LSVSLRRSCDIVHDSVRHVGNDWVQRFYALREDAEVATQPECPCRVFPVFNQERIIVFFAAGNFATGSLV
jgi:hypothetical protein